VAAVVVIVMGVVVTGVTTSGGGHAGRTPPRSAPRSGGAPSSVRSTGSNSALASLAAREPVPTPFFGTTGAGQLWALDGSGLFTTSDGGNTWRTITPPGGTDDPIAVMNAVSFLTASQGCVMVDIPLDGGHPTVQCTRNGGTTWTGTAFPSPPHGTGNEDVGLLDANQGWLTLGIGISRRYLLYVTDNGGSSWTEVADDLPVGQIQFTSPTNAWGVAPDGTGSTLYRSVDGGVSWAPTALPLPSPWRGRHGAPALAFGLPTFFGSNGVLTVQDTATGSLGVETSSDGGATWSAGRRLPGIRLPVVTGLADSSPHVFPVEALTASTWMAWTGHAVRTTTDAGAHWSATIDATLPPSIDVSAGTGDPVTTISFATTSDGWSDGQLPTGTREVFDLLVHTTDGGRHVTLVAWPGSGDTTSVPGLPGIALAGTTFAGRVVTP
jgi:hypothetical protein